MRIGALVLLLATSPAAVLAQDRSPLRDYHVWLPMTGATPDQIDDAVNAGYNAILLKVGPPPTPDGNTVGPGLHDEIARQASARRCFTPASSTSRAGRAR